MSPEEIKQRFRALEPKPTETYEAQQAAFAADYDGEQLVPDPCEERGMPEPGMCDEDVDCLIDGLLDEVSLLDRSALRSLSEECLQRIARVQVAASRTRSVSERVQEALAERSVVSLAQDPEFLLSGLLTDVVPWDRAPRPWGPTLLWPPATPTRVWRDHRIEGLIQRLATLFQGRGTVPTFVLEDHALDPGTLGKTESLMTYGIARVLAVRLGAQMPSQDRLRVFFHEMGHALGFQARPLRSDVEEEIAAEMTAFMTMEGLGFDETEFTSSYLSHYGVTLERFGAPEEIKEIAAVVRTIQAAIQEVGGL